MSLNTVSSEVIDRRLNDIFEEYDSNKDGKLSKNDLTRFLNDTLKEMGKNRDITREEVLQFIWGHDLNKDGEIAPYQFKALIMKILKKGKTH